jgi:molybdopterin-binding protein
MTGLPVRVRVALVRVALVRVALVRVALVRVALVRVAFVRVVILASCHGHELATRPRRRQLCLGGTWATCTRRVGMVGLPVVGAWGTTVPWRIGVVMRLSARNNISATVSAISRGQAIANVVLDAGGTRLVASITVEAVRELGLTEGSEVIAIIKASDVIIGVPD